MVTARTVGSLNGFTIRKEDTYGVFSTVNASSYGGSLITLDDKMSQEWEQDVSESRVFSDVVCTSTDYGFTAEFRYPRSSSWTKWMEYALGSLSGVQDDADSFSAVFNVAKNERMAFFGCKINTLTLKADSRGKPVVFSADVLARYCPPVTTGPDAVFSNFGTPVSFPAEDRPGFAPITFCSPIQYSTDNGATWIDAKAKDLNLTVNQNLQAEPDAVIVGANCYSLGAGLGSVPQASEIKLSFSITSQNSLWDSMKKNETKDLKFKFTLDGHTVTLTGCYLSGEMPSRSQGVYDETITAIAQDITVV